ncbi:MAG: STAS domain-containing protein [Clostridia bacterium]|nr:STAS domain-containing protein [Clostridia bacterium]
MEIVKSKKEGVLSLRISGRLDTTTAPELEAVLKEELTDIKELDLDFGSLDYVSSAGLRILLQTQKTMNTLGKMEIRNVNDSVMEVFDITGFSDILTIIR